MWPTTPPAWLLSWLIWRFRNQEGPRPEGVPKEVPPWAWGVAKWMGWVRKGRIPPRPKSTTKAPIPDRIPKWAWPLERQLRIAVPTAPQPPPPLPANPIPPSSWKLPGPLMLTAWAWTNDSAWRDTDDGLRRCADAGVRTIALQVMNGQPLFAPSVPDRCREYVEHVVIWGHAHPNDGVVLQNAKASGYLPQIETAQEYLWAEESLSLGNGAGLSLSTVTTLAGFYTWSSRPDGQGGQDTTTVEYERLEDLGCTHAWVECYDWDVRPMAPANQMFQAGQVGFYHANPVIGLADRAGVFVSSYQPAIDRYGRQLGVYLAEPMRAIDWQAVGGL